MAADVIVWLPVLIYKGLLHQVVRYFLRIHSAVCMQIINHVFQPTPVDLVPVQAPRDTVVVAAKEYAIPAMRRKVRASFVRAFQGLGLVAHLAHKDHSGRENILAAVACYDHMTSLLLLRRLTFRPMRLAVLPLGYSISQRTTRPLVPSSMTDRKMVMRSLRLPYR
jgi:hypothetical protein